MYLPSKESAAQIQWHYRYLSIVDQVSQWSKDTSTKVGAVIVGDAGQILATGYNGIPRGVNDYVPARHERPEKYLWFEHAERNAIYNAARSGLPLVGSVLYVQWHPCADCARGVIQSGISRVILRTYKIPESWRASCKVGSVMFQEAGVQVDWMGND